MSETQPISVQTAAKQLKCTPHYIRKLLRENKITGGKISGSRHLHVYPASLEKFKNTEDYSNDIKQLRQDIPITIMDAVQDLEAYFKTDLIAHVSAIGAPMTSITHDDCIILDDLLNSLEPEHKGTDGKKFNKITLFLHSGGGILEAAIKFVDIINHYANHFDVIVPMMAKSAATLISLSAENLYMTPVTELGPVDPIVQSPTNPNIQVPARSINDLIKSYSREQKASKTDERTEVEKMLLKKIEELDIYVLGNYESALVFSKDQIRERLSTKITNPSTLENAVHEFTEKHPSHSFPITPHILQEFGIGTLIEEEKMNAVKTLLAVYQSFMAGNKIVKTTGNRNMNRNVVLQAANNNVQVPTKTAI
ncbi:hypothetical protein ACFLZH_04080 [Patescibacteria group bacterium]